MKIENKAFSWYEKYKKKMTKKDLYYFFPHPGDTARYDNKYEKEQIKIGQQFLDLSKEIEEKALDLYECTRESISEHGPVFAAATCLAETQLDHLVGLETPALLVLCKEDVHIYTNNCINFGLNDLCDRINESNLEWPNYFKDYIFSHSNFLNMLKINKRFEPFVFKLNEISFVCPQLSVVECFKDFIAEIENAEYLSTYNKMSISELEELSDDFDEDADFTLGKRYYEGIGVEINVKLAIQYLQSAMKKSSEEAIDYLEKIMIKYPNSSICYDLYDYFETESNTRKAIKRLRESASLGNSDAIYELAKRYYYGDGVRIDYDLSLSFFQKLSPKYNIDEYMGKIYYEKKDYTNAVIYLEKAANEGSILSSKLMAFCYIDGKGVEKDNDKAIYWSSRADGKNCPKCGSINYVFFKVHPQIKANLIDRLKGLKVDKDGFKEDKSRIITKVRCNSCKTEWLYNDWK